MYYYCCCCLLSTSHRGIRSVRIFRSVYQVLQNMYVSMSLDKGISRGGGGHIYLDFFVFLLNLPSEKMCIHRSDTIFSRDGARPSLSIVDFIQSNVNIALRTALTRPRNGNSQLPLPPHHMYACQASEKRSPSSPRNGPRPRRQQIIHLLSIYSRYDFMHVCGCQRRFSKFARQLNRRGVTGRWTLRGTYVQRLLVCQKIPGKFKKPNKTHALLV